MHGPTCTFRASLTPLSLENCHWGVVTGPDDDPSKNIGVGMDRSSAPTQEWCPFNLCASSPAPPPRSYPARAVLTVQLLPARRFRTSGDIRQTWASVHRNLQTALPYLDKDKPISQPHCWAYPDSACQAATQCLSCYPRAAGSICCAGTSAAGRKSANGRAKSSPLRRVVCDQRAALSGLRPPQSLARGRDDAHNRQRGSDRRESTVCGEWSLLCPLALSTATGAACS